MHRRRPRRRIKIRFLASNNKGGGSEVGKGELVGKEEGGMGMGDAYQNLVGLALRSLTRLGRDISCGMNRLKKRRPLPREGK